VPGGTRTLLITGCSSGIGLAAARTMQARGWKVLATCRKAADCERLREEGLISFRLDYEDRESIREGFERALEEGDGRIDALFNNGAYGIPGFVEDLPGDALRAIFEANFFGWHELTRLVLPVMSAQGAGRIVQNSSILGFAAMKYRGAYNSTKFAVEGYSDTLRLELAGSGIKVILIEPGPIDTKIRENSYGPFKRWIDWRNSRNKAFYEEKMIPRLEAERVDSPFELQPDAVVKKLIHALESPRPHPRYYVTVPTHAFGILKRLLPTRTLDWIARKAVP
jgi:NAD(P)-dependent dehydrogenase (short-subunit alcohol dehydrogenase family)